MSSTTRSEKPASAAPSGEPSALDSHLGYWLRFVSNQVSHRFQREVERQGVSVSEWVVLRTLYASVTASPSELATAMGMTRGAVSKLLTRLEEKGLASMVCITSDQRRRSIELTRQGRALVPRLSQVADENDELFFASLSKQRRQQLLETLQEIVRVNQMQSAPVD